MSKKIPITNLHHFTDWSATQSENSSIRFDFSSKIHSARAAQTAWQNRSERCWKMDDQRPSNAWTRFALGDLGGISSPKRLLLWPFHFYLIMTLVVPCLHNMFSSQWLCTPPKTIVSSTEKNSIRRMQIHTFRTESSEGMVTMQTIYTLCSSQHLQRQ